MTNIHYYVAKNIDKFAQENKELLKELIDAPVIDYDKYIADPEVAIAHLQEHPDEDIFAFVGEKP